MGNVMIVGSSGAGKSTLARDLGRRLGLRVIHIDQLYWQAGWQIRPKAECRALIEEAIAEDGWIFDGNNSSSFDLRLPRADTIIWLDYPRALCLRRTLWRIAKGYGRTRADLAGGCPEKLDWAFLWWIWTFPEHSKPKFERLFAAQAGNKRLVRLRSPKALRSWLETLPQASGTG